MNDAVYYHSEISKVIQKQKQGQCVIIGDAFRGEIEAKIEFNDQIFAGSD